MSKYVYEDAYEIEVLVWTSKNGAIGQNTLYGFSSNLLYFQGPN